MIDEQKRKAISTLYNEGVKIRKIAKILSIDRKTIRKIISVKKAPDLIAKRNKISIDEELLRRTYARCQGKAERTREVLEKEFGIKIAYSTLTLLIRKLNLKNKGKDRAAQVLVGPGEEFQHDTSPYNLKIGGRSVRVQASLIYYRHSKVRYLKFYKSFNRFAMKCFFFEALHYFGYVPSKCIIDNTNLAVLHGTGKNAVIVPEMESFANMFKFKWLAHEVGHADRKAGVESGFRYIEVNFIPGREFSSFEDLNRQALKWCKDISIKPTTREKIIPTEMFNLEIPYMKKVLPGLPAPYRQHQREIDQYGYIAFNGNYYWVPIDVSGTVVVLEFYEKIELYNNRKKVGEYLLPAELVKNKRFVPEGVPIRKKPKNRKFSSQEEEKRLRAIDNEVGNYIDTALKEKRPSKGRHQFIRELYALSKKVSPSIFKAALLRALKFSVYDLHILNNICTIIIRNDNYVLPETDVKYDFEERDSYIEGAYSDGPDLEKYIQINQERSDGST